MKLVGEFLKKFNSLQPPHDSLKKELLVVLKQTVNITVQLKQIVIKNEVAYVYTSSVLKNVIQINRAKILNELYERLPKSRDSVRDVR